MSDGYEDDMTAEEFDRRMDRAIPADVPSLPMVTLVVETAAGLSQYPIRGLLVAPHHYRADGKEKVGYATQQEAEEALKRCRGQNAYQCPTCGQWHLGHRP